MKLPQGMDVGHAIMDCRVFGLTLEYGSFRKLAATLRTHGGKHTVLFKEDIEYLILHGLWRSPSLLLDLIKFFGRGRLKRLNRAGLTLTLDYSPDPDEPSGLYIVLSEKA